MKISFLDRFFYIAFAFFALFCALKTLILNTENLFFK